MNKFLFVLIMLAVVLQRAPAQQSGGEASLLKQLAAINASAAASPSPAPAFAGTEAKTAEPVGKPPTEITATKETTYDEKTHKAVFTGDVRVNDPQFKITCDQLTAFLRDNSAKPAASPSPTAKVSPGASPAKTGGGGLKSAIAEGHVVIIQDKPGVNGEAPQHNVGKCQRAEYNAETGDVTLTGWPQVQQGINTQIATQESTVMVMNRDGHTMKTKGPSKTVIQDQSDDKRQ